MTSERPLIDTVNEVVTLLNGLQQAGEVAAVCCHACATPMGAASVNGMPRWKCASCPNTKHVGSIDLLLALNRRADMRAREVTRIGTGM